MGKNKQKKIRRKIERGISGFIIFLISLSLLFALFSYHSGNLSPSQQINDDPTRDIFRTYNAYVSQFMFKTIGYTSFAVVLFFLTAGIVMFLNKTLIILIKPTIFLCITGLSIPLLIALTVDSGSDTAGIEPAMHYGGLLGSLLNHFMVRNFGKVGTYLLSVGAVLISLVLTTNLRPSAVAEFFISGMKMLQTILPEPKSTSAADNMAGEQQAVRETMAESHTGDSEDIISILTPQEKDAISKAFEQDDENSPGDESPSS